MRRLLGSLVAVGVVLLVGISPAAAKFWAFDLEISRAEVEVGQAIRVDATVAEEFARQSAASSGIVPPVDVYRTDQLPASGPISGEERPVASVQFDHVGDGRFRGEIALAEPGSYHLVSMGVWNFELDGYPAPIPLQVVAADDEPLRSTSDQWSFAVVPGAALALAAGAALLWTRRTRAAA